MSLPAKSIWPAASSSMPAPDPSGRYSMLTFGRASLYSVIHFEYARSGNVAPAPFREMVFGATAPLFPHPQRDMEIANSALTAAGQFFPKRVICMYLHGEVYSRKQDSG